MNSDFYKKPSFIAGAVIVLASLFLSLFKYSLPNDETVSVSALQTLTKGISYTKSDLKADQLKSIAEGQWKVMSTAGIGFLDVLSMLLPILAGILMFVAWKGTNDVIKDSYIKPIKIALVALSSFLVVRYLMKLGLDITIDSFGPGLGLWLTVLASLFILFEDKVMEMINSKK
jgi:hypothetical protein